MPFIDNKHKYILPEKFCEPIRKMKGWKDQIVFLSVELKDGQVIHDLMVDNCRELMGSEHLPYLPFNAKDVIRVFQTEKQLGSGVHRRYYLFLNLGPFGFTWWFWKWDQWYYSGG